MLIPQQTGVYRHTVDMLNTHLIIWRRVSAELHWMREVCGSCQSIDTPDHHLPQVLPQIHWWPASDIRMEPRQLKHSRVVESFLMKAFIIFTVNFRLMFTIWLLWLYMLPIKLSNKDISIQIGDLKKVLSWGSNV